jgi:hypothetical protein
LLQSGYNDGCGDDEKNKLHELQSIWQQQKDAQQQQLLHQVHGLQMEYA